MSPPYCLRRALILWLPLITVGALLISAGITTGDQRPTDIGLALAVIGVPAIILDRPHRPTS